MWGVTPLDLWDLNALHEIISRNGIMNSLLVALMPTALITHNHHHLLILYFGLSLPLFLRFFTYLPIATIGDLNIRSEIDHRIPSVVVFSVSPFDPLEITDNSEDIFRCLIGDSRVGKPNLLSRLTRDEFSLE
ncbi:hypothetical protein LXL04_012755 [Taraxacum kok-saghyz]